MKEKISKKLYINKIKFLKKYKKHKKCEELIERELRNLQEKVERCSIEAKKCNKKILEKQNNFFKIFGKRRLKEREKLKKF